MASKAIKFLEEHQSETPSRFAEEAAWRKENAGWLRWSRQLAVTLIGGQAEIPVHRFWEKC